ncbi:MAG: hypothetical protein ACK415_06050, partial [Thermodesulfovibrionales bacterium]
ILFCILYTRNKWLVTGKGILRAGRAETIGGEMDITIIATIGFTSLAALGILYLFFSMRKK